MQSSLKAVGSGGLVIGAWILGASLLLATILRFTSMSEASLTWVFTTVGCLAFLFGGMKAGKMKKERGLFIGLATGIAVSLLIFIIQWTGYNQSMDTIKALFHLLYIGMALVGGIVGVNLGARHQ
ncbi:TIGR04086 family membrane protein [Aureibacillus halotolerans]|uniref:Putative membrane protein (TIGR04086 family) n=1 Tax=Aureibacillus halotolerans TaxID=1508390 RepID=A0A4R6U4N2_9BACI|nr:TIGR04086 family membrane protein [Aureibacillus halotolerans]TDQ37984.1 putative membrane protein (TIGR04086 family) [Aureibacillus halotolerans]